MLKEKVINKYKTLKKLQEENNRLKERNHINIERNAQAYKIVEDYEQRIKKAVEYINNNPFINSIAKVSILNILQNGSDENVKD